MDNTEKIINEFESHVKSFTPACTSDERFKECCESVLELLKGMKEQKQTVLDSIEEAQISISDYVMHSRTEYEQGKFDGLEVAYGIVGDKLEVGEQE